MLIDPSAEDPTLHLQYSPTTGRFSALTKKGERSIAVFGVHRTVLETSRRTTADVAKALVLYYDDLLGAGRDAEADKIRRSLRRLPHGSVVDWLCRVARSPNAADILPSEVIAAIQRRAELP